jgi:uncharacterized protein (TIGR02453 family)
MAWFELEMLDFFADLEFNNNREWFEQNKKRYEAKVKKPMEAFAAEMIGRMQQIEPQVSMAPKDAIFRIYRDIRFSKDKTPYNTNAGLYISPSGKNHHGSPGVYFHVDARSMGIASGYYTPEPAQVRAIRTHIAANLDEFAELLAEPEFHSLFGTFAGEQNKVLPAEFRSVAEIQPLIFKKQFYYWAQFDATEVARDDLADLIIRHYLAAKPMNAFLTTGIKELEI